MLKIKQIKENQADLSKINKKFLSESRFFELFSDPTRLKIVYLLNKNRELCVTDLARILNLSVSAVSHQLRMLETSEIVVKIRKGKIICYSPKRSNKVNLILNL